MLVRGTSMWAKVFEGYPNALSGKYQVDICNLDKNTVAELNNVGVNVKSDPEKGDFVTAKGVFAPKVFDASKQIWDVKKAIGNGSTIKVSAKPYDWTFKGKSGVGLGLNQLMVVKLVEYSLDELEPEEGEGGFEDIELDDEI